MRAEPGREATIGDVARQLGTCLAELGLHYDSINEAVIPAGQKRRRGHASQKSIRAIKRLPRRLAAVGLLPRTKPLRAPSGGAIMTL
jgi:hypothetical protein